MLLELFLLEVYLSLQFNYALSQSKLRSNGALESNADANGELKVIKAEILIIKPLINEVPQNVYIKEGQIVEDLRLLLALDQLLQSIFTNYSSEDKSMGLDSFLRMAAGVSA